MIDSNLFDLSLSDPHPSYINEKTVIKLSRNGDFGKPLFSFTIDLKREPLSKIKKFVMKKLEVPDYKNPQTCSRLRLFTAKGVEVFEYDNLPSFQLINNLYFSFGDDFDYSVRLYTLKQKSELGKGGFGVVNLMYDSLNGLDVAVKLINFRNSPIDSQMMKKEVIALSNLEHQNIVKLIDSFPDNQNQLVVIMEYLSGGELYDYWHRFSNRRMPEREACEIILQLAQGLDYCHNKKIIHRDVKFQNIMLKEEIYTLPIDNEMSGIKIKIVDFGIFGSSKGTCSEKSTAGSLKYMAPELLSGRTQSTPKIDVWSMGCMLYAMVTGDYPFNGNEREELKKEILTKVTKVRTKYNQDLSEYCLDIIERMLNKEPNYRISISEILDHPWFMDH